MACTFTYFAYYLTVKYGEKNNLNSNDDNESDYRSKSVQEEAKSLIIYHEADDN
jgi:hypothetical protein